MLAAKLCVAAPLLHSAQDDQTILDQMRSHIALIVQSVGLTEGPQAKAELTRLTSAHANRLAATFTARLDADHWRGLSTQGADGQLRLERAVDGWVLNQIGLTLLNLAPTDQAAWLLSTTDLSRTPRGKRCTQQERTPPTPTHLAQRRAFLEIYLAQIGTQTRARVPARAPSSRSIVWAMLLDTLTPGVPAPPFPDLGQAEIDAEYGCEVWYWWLRRATSAPSQHAHALDDVLTATVNAIATNAAAIIRAASAPQGEANAAPDGYPSAAALYGVTGETIVELTLALDGTPSDAVVVSRRVDVPGLQGEQPRVFEHVFDDAALEMTLARRFPAATAAGLPKSRRVQLPYSWKLDP
jgi:hypothetical protein